ncbi:hypothetical protein PPERSA_12604 [Pseudocohnilembus persalinus]|uniref:Uncharacterized protein n=1 Tax=Pseudocohnilembus persalinus TaxID=266149 RepID=A0A0V0QCJ7_PSEPJ|nr:hypothetical protein PPERSA_12604 [Pseudocohnilembus persalinus]|eukprot:KRW99928.1 hypothetical protein PPERSA_12604 [Pseudocohnilembus persalinus]
MESQFVLIQCEKLILLGIKQDESDIIANKNHYLNKQNPKSNEFYKQCIDQLEAEIKKLNEQQEENKLQIQELNYIKAVALCKLAQNYDFKFLADEKYMLAAELLQNLLIPIKQKEKEFYLQNRDFEQKEISQYKEQIENSILKLEEFQQLNNLLLKYFSKFELYNILLRFGSRILSRYLTWKLSLQIQEEEKDQEIISEAKYYQGLFYYDIQDYGKSIPYFEEGIKLNQNNAKILFKLGFAYQDQDLNENAFKTYQKVTQIDPNYGKAYFNLGVMLENDDKMEEAEIYYKKCIEKNKNMTLAYNNLGLIYLDLGKTSEGIKLFEQAIEIDPKYKNPVFNLADLYYKNNDIKKSAQYFEKYLEIEPADYDANYQLGEIYEYLKNYEKAIEQFSKSLYIDGTQTINYIKISDILAKQGKKKEQIGTLVQGCLHFPELIDDIKPQHLQNLVNSLVKIRNISERSYIRLGYECQAVLISKLWQMVQKSELDKKIAQDMMNFENIFQAIEGLCDIWEGIWKYDDFDQDINMEINLIQDLIGCLENHMDIENQLIIQIFRLLSLQFEGSSDTDIIKVVIDNQLAKILANITFNDSYQLGELALILAANMTQLGVEVRDDVIKNKVLQNAINRILSTQEEKYKNYIQYVNATAYYQRVNIENIV